MAAPYRVLGLTVPVTEALDPALWRTRYAHGLVLGALSGALDTATKSSGCGHAAKTMVKTLDEIKPDVIRWHLRAALSELEVKMGMALGIVTCKATPTDDGVVLGRHYDKVAPRLPWLNAGMAGGWWRIPLPPSVISVERVRSYYWTESPVVEISTEQGNLDLLRLEKGVLYIFPTSLATIALAADAWALAFATGPGNSWFQPYNMIRRDAVNTPEFWAVDYTLGPTTQEGGQVGHLEAVLADWVYCTAAQKLLPMAAMAVTRGVSGSTIGMDGISRSVPLANGGAIYKALADVYKETTERIDWKALQSYKRGITVAAYS